MSRTLHNSSCPDPGSSARPHRSSQVLVRVGGTLTNVRPFLRSLGLMSVVRAKMSQVRANFGVVAQTLTTGQKAQILAAYKETFAAHNQGEALKALYATFSEQYGIQIEALRRLISEELNSNPTQYRRLARARASRQAAAGSSPKVMAEAKKAWHGDTAPKRIVPRRKCPACSQEVEVHRKKLVQHRFNGVACSGKTAICAVCRRSYALRATDKRLIAHPGKNGSECGGSGRAPFKQVKRTPEATHNHRCPVCRRGVATTSSGTVRGHNAHGNSGLLVWCPGSGRKIDAPQKSRGTPDDRSGWKSIRAVRGGLPT